jgi:hypothetical protein
LARLPRRRAITEASVIAGLVVVMLLVSGHVAQPNRPSVSPQRLTPLQLEARTLQNRLLQAQATYEALAAQAVTAPAELAALGRAHSQGLTSRLSAIESERREMAQQLATLRAQLAGVQARIAHKTAGSQTAG